MTTADAASIPSGYDAGFLDTRVPLPATVGGVETRDLAYLHFSVSLASKRRLAAVTGVNIDGALLHDLDRTGDWAFDPRVPESAQTGPAVYLDNALDRGHLVRRRDPGWGELAEAKAATEATFVYTNAAPQASVFNQSKDLWLGLENHVLEFADAADLRISVFTAPVLGAEDPPYRGIQVPLRFWKVAAWMTGGAGSQLAAAGFVLDQTDLIDLSEGMLSVAPLGGYHTYQVPIADIAALAGVDLGPLVAADVLADKAGVGRAGWLELARPSDIRLSHG